MHVCTTGCVVSARSNSSTLHKTPFYEFILWESLMNIFLRVLDVVFSLFYTVPQEQRWEWCQSLSFPLCCFITVQPPLLTSLTHWQYTHLEPFGWQAGIQLFLQKLIFPVDSASRIRIPECNPNDHTALKLNFENIRASSELLRSKSIVSAYFSRVGIYIPKMPSRTGRFLRLRMKGAGVVLSLCQEVVLLFASAPHLTACFYAEGWEMSSATGASAPECVRNSHSDTEQAPNCIHPKRYKFSLDLTYLKKIAENFCHWTWKWLRFKNLWVWGNWIHCINLGINLFSKKKLFWGFISFYFSLFVLLLLVFCLFFCIFWGFSCSFFGIGY